MGGEGASVVGLRPLVEGPLRVAATAATCFASFEIVRRVGWLRPLFGLAPAAAVRAPAGPARAARLPEPSAS